MWQPISSPRKNQSQTSTGLSRHCVDKHPHLSKPTPCTFQISGFIIELTHFCEQKVKLVCDVCKRLFDLLSGWLCWLGCVLVYESISVKQMVNNQHELCGKHTYAVLCLFCSDSPVVASRLAQVGAGACPSFIVHSGSSGVGGGC